VYRLRKIRVSKSEAALHQSPYNNLHDRILCKVSWQKPSSEALEHFARFYISREHFLVLDALKHKRMSPIEPIGVLVHK
jgi:hypothetical protein